MLEYNNDFKLGKQGRNMVKIHGESVPLGRLVSEFKDKILSKLRKSGMVISTEELERGFVVFGVRGDYHLEEDEENNIYLTIESRLEEGSAKNLEEYVRREVGSNIELDNHTYFGKAAYTSDSSTFISLVCRIKKFPKNKQGKLDLPSLYDQIWTLLTHTMRGVYNSKLNSK